MGRALWAGPRGVTIVSVGTEERGPLTCRVTWWKSPRTGRAGKELAEGSLREDRAWEQKGPDPERHGSFVANPSGKNAKMEVHCQKKCALENRSRPSGVRKPRELGALGCADAPRGWHV